MIRSRLYIKIYLTVLTSLALVVVIIGTMAYVGRFDGESNFADRLNHFVSVMLMEGKDQPERAEMVDRLADALGADIALYDKQGKFLLGAGAWKREPMQMPSQKSSDRLRDFRATLADGTLVKLRLEPPRPPRFNLIFSILAIAAATAVAAYPAVRHLTRRLDLLRLGVEKWGQGDLTARATVIGKDEIATVARAFNEAANRVEALVNSQKSLLANASHELRSPLARLRMACEIFQHNPSDSMRQEIDKNLAELDELVEEILMKSRLGSNQPIATDQIVDLLALAAEEASLVDASIDGDSVTIRGNERYLRRMIRNLLQNAARHGKPPIDVYLSVTGGNVCLTVRDHGNGLKSHEVERIFEPFYRPEGRSEAAGGWGLGLALVAEIARLHHGRAYYSQPEDGGALFCVELPVEATAA
ncbi:sensor histidine kinase [Rhizobium alvei]|uniref:histidine kinase n=1 Tax=Rhizobium alvei TaxID=1132659 RepID=A0ABT8YQQ9_9HYPH|nr:ATP-binding protein [Rhizobium alvei]MDO6965856.1 ATP-binding protein [Rhizobium alvei]